MLQLKPPAAQMPFFSNFATFCFLRFLTGMAGLLSLNTSTSLTSAAMVVRKATCDDLEGIMNVVLNAMPQDPAWDYRFPHRKEYPEDERKFQTLFFEFLIDPSYEDFEVRVLGTPRDDDAGKSIIAAVAVWDVTYLNKRRNGPDYVTKHRS